MRLSNCKANVTECGRMEANEGQWKPMNGRLPVEVNESELIGHWCTLWHPRLWSTDSVELSLFWILIRSHKLIAR